MSDPGWLHESYFHVIDAIKSSPLCTFTPFPPAGTNVLNFRSFYLSIHTLFLLGGFPTNINLSLQKTDISAAFSTLLNNRLFCCSRQSHESVIPSHLNIPQEGSRFMYSFYQIGRCDDAEFGGSFLLTNFCNCQSEMKLYRPRQQVYFSLQRTFVVLHTSYV